MPDTPVARSPIQPAPPMEVRDGWEVSALCSVGALRLADRTPLIKVLVRASTRGRVATSLGVPFGRARLDRHGTLIIGSGPDEWLLLAPPHSLGVVTGRVDTTDDDLVSVVDVTHGRALMRLSGADAHRVLAKVCAIDLSDAVTPDGASFRCSVAKVATDIVRDDARSLDAPECSYLLHCERSSGQYLFDALLDAGREFGIQVDGFTLDRAVADD
ncbi:MAG: sarcosine oxidase subunit gamma family protein [Nocardioidaceae bacterium]